VEQPGSLQRCSEWCQEVTHIEGRRVSSLAELGIGAVAGLSGTADHDVMIFMLQGKFNVR